jgi:hypothetical protein
MGSAAGAGKWVGVAGTEASKTTAAVCPRPVFQLTPLEGSSALSSRTGTVAGDPRKKKGKLAALSGNKHGKLAKWMTKSWQKRVHLSAR